MIESVTQAEFDASVSAVWSVVTNNNDFSWRTDLSKLEIFDHSKFMEIDSKGICSTMTITKKEANSYYELDMQNKNENGIFSAKFTALGENKCAVTFTQKLTYAKGFAQFMAKIKGSVKKSQAQYVADLKAAITKI